MTPASASPCRPARSPPMSTARLQCARSTATDTRAIGRRHSARSNRTGLRGTRTKRPALRAAQTTRARRTDSAFSCRSGRLVRILPAAGAPPRATNTSATATRCSARRRHSDAPGILMRWATARRRAPATAASGRRAWSNRTVHFCPATTPTSRAALRRVLDTRATPTRCSALRCRSAHRMSSSRRWQSASAGVAARVTLRRPRRPRARRQLRQ
jgi:hypothetical protein